MSEFISIRDHVRSLPWRHRLRVWLAGFKVRRMIRQGWRPTVYDCCRQCLHPIRWNDDAGVCVRCGGRNDRIADSAGGGQ